MKKIISAVLLLVIFSITAYAGDEPESYLTDDYIKMFTATILNVTRETIDIRVNRKIKGDISENELLTLPYFEYDSKSNTKPEIHDSCLITMKNDKVTFRIQTTSTDPKTLKFINHITNISMNMEGQSVYERIEQYINDGSYEAAEQRRQNKLINKAAAVIAQASEKNITSKTNELTTVESSTKNKSYAVLVYLIIGVIVLAGFLFIVKVKKK